MKKFVKTKKITAGALLFAILAVMLAPAAWAAEEAPPQRYVPTVTQRLPYFNDFSDPATIADFDLINAANTNIGGTAVIENGVLTLTRTEAQRDA